MCVYVSISPIWRNTVTAREGRIYLHLGNPPVVLVGILYPRGEPYRGLASAADDRRQDLIALCVLTVMLDGSVQTAGCAGYVDT